VADWSRLTLTLLAPASSVHTRRWATALSTAGHRVIVASWQPGPPIPGAEVCVAPGAGTAPVRRLALASPWLRRIVADARTDVVHVHSVGVHGLLSLALPHGPACAVTPWGSELWAARYSVGRAAVVRLALRKADLVMPTSTAVAREVTTHYGVQAKRVRVLSWGVGETLIAAQSSISRNVVRSAYEIPAQAIVVLSIRSAAATYRIHEIMSAFVDAATERPGLFLVVLAGNCPDRETARLAKEGYLDLIREAADAKQGRVRIIERALSPSQTFELMCASDIAVSIPPADQRSSSVLEAALAGCRLLLSDIAPYREMIKDGLEANLLAEPIVANLARELRTASAAGAGQLRNKKFILANEHGADKTAVLEQTYRQLSARAIGRRRRGSRAGS
jgi:glycosyltransferase involved in cell wall biosynthesis